MPRKPTTETEALRARLETAEGTLAAIRAGAVDALVIDGQEGRRVYTLNGADQVYRTLVERIEEGACALATSGVVLFCNGALARLLGRPLRSVTGRSLREFLAAVSHDRLTALIAEALTGRPVRAELRLESLATGTVPVEIALTLFSASGEIALAGIVSDLREHKRREAELESRVAERTHALRAALSRATTAEHEVRKREQQLSSFKDSLEARVLERTAEVSHLADQLRVLAAELSHTEQRERRRLSKILHDHVQQLLVAARMQVELARRDNDPFRRATVLQGAESILQEATTASRSLASELSPPVLHEAGLAGGLIWLAARFEEQHQFAVQVQAENDAEPAREEIRSLVFDCVRELLLNAVKHSGVSEARVILAKAPDDTLEVVVRDEGKGFAPEALRNRSVDQLTFGLFSIEQRLAYVGGQMIVDAAPGRGTLVRLIAPRGREPSLPPPVPKAPELHAASEELRPGTAREQVVRVVIADDHQMVRQGFVSLLRLEQGIEVVAEAADGPSAIDVVARFAPDVVLMDVNLAGMNGIEVTRVITTQHPEVRVVGLSMHVAPEIVHAMLAAGAVAFVAKSGDFQDVVDAVRAAVRAKKRRRKPRSDPHVRHP